MCIIPHKSLLLPKGFLRVIAPVPIVEKKYRYKYKDDGVLPAGDHEIVISYNPEKCCGCQICELACKWDAIKGGELIKAAGKKIIPPEIDEKECRFCGSCVAACPYDSLEFLIDGEKIERTSLFHLDSISGKIETSCRAKCKACIEACPNEAISLRKEYSPKSRIEIDEENCIMCGTCEKICDYKEFCYIDFRPKKAKVLKPEEKLRHPFNLLIPQSEIKSNLKGIPKKSRNKAPKG